MIDGIKERAVSRKTLGFLAGLAFFILGGSDVVEVTTEEQLLSGGMAIASLFLIGIVDAVKAWRGTN